MPESDAHIPGMNAVSFVAYCGQLAGLPAVDAMQRAHEVLYYVGLGEARYRNVETYSTGMKQRIKLAQALVHDPDLLFLDEPTNGMDPKGRDEMLELVRDLGPQQGRQPDPVVASPARRRIHLRLRRRHGQGAGRDAGADRGAEGTGRTRLRAARQRATCAASSTCSPTTAWMCTRPTRTSCASSCPPKRGGDQRAIFTRGRASSASRCGTCGRACRRSKTSSPKRSARVGADVQHAYSRSKLSPLRRRARRRVGRSWTGDRVGRHPDVHPQAHVHGHPAVRAGAVHRPRRCSSISRRTIRRRRFLAPTAETFRDFLEQQDFFVFVITVYVGAGLIANDRRANALQIYLSKPLMRSEYIAGKLAVLFAFLLLVTLVPAMLLLLLQVDVRRQLRVPARTTCSSFRRSPSAACSRCCSRRSRCWRCPRCRRARRFVGIMYVGIIFFTERHLRRALRDHRQQPRRRGSRSATNVDAGRRRRSSGSSRATRRRGRCRCWCIVGADRRLALGARTARPRRGGGDVSAGARSIAEPRPDRRARRESPRHVSKWYGQVIGLNDVTVAVPPGVTGLLGPNGAGKSTFMKLITGQLKPSKGTSRSSASRSGATRRSTSRSASARSRTRSTSG